MIRKVVYWLYRYATCRSYQPNSNHWRKRRAWLWLQLATRFRRERTQCQT